MARCQKKECNVSKKREKLINDFQELIDCMEVSPNETPVAGQITVHKQLVCVPCPDGDGNNKEPRGKNPCADDDSWKKDRYKSRELKGGVLIEGCDCLKRNGLQHDCPRSECMGRPPCLLKPWPDCIPSGGTGLRGAEPRVSKYPYKPAPCPVPDFPLGYEEDQCHKAEVDCKKCVPVLMCRPGEVWECLEGKCPPNPPSDYKYQSTQLQTQCNTQSQQQQCPLGKLMQLQECPLASQCPNNSQPREERLATNVIGQEIICQPDRGSSRLREMQQSIGCPNRGPHQRPGYETPQRLCRPADPQPIQQTVHSSARNGLGGGRHCDPPTHVLKHPTYEALPKPPECPKPKMIHHPGGKVLPNYQQLLGGQLLTRCDCLRANGLQDDCQLRQCGIPECLERPPDCLPAGGRGPKPRSSTASSNCPGAGTNGGTYGSTCPPGYQRYICFSPNPAANFCYDS